MFLCPKRNVAHHITLGHAKERVGGYVTGLTESQHKGAPKYSGESSWDWANPNTAKSVDEYYATPRLS